MEMKNEEIVRRYKEAADKKKQVEILAELNCCEKNRIIDILRESGIDPRTLPRNRKKQEEKPPTISGEIKPTAQKPVEKRERLYPAPTISEEEKAKALRACAEDRQQLKTVTPRKEHEMARARELALAIRAYAAAAEPINPEWVSEYNELIERRSRQ